MNEADIAVLVTVDAVFPGTTPDRSSMLAALKELSRDDALFACARLNAVVSDFGPGRSTHQRQTQAVGMLCTEEQLRGIASTEMTTRGKALRREEPASWHCDTDRRVCGAKGFTLVGEAEDRPPLGA